MAFGVPMAGITMGTFGARGRGRGRGRVHPVTQSARTLKIQLIILPKDVSRTTGQRYQAELTC